MSNNAPKFNRPGPKPATPAAIPHGPPSEDIPAGELWELLQTIPRPIRNVPFPRNIPGTDEPVGELAIWPLTQEEHHQSNVAAEIEVRRRLKDEIPKSDEVGSGYASLVANEIAVQQLWRACRDVKDPVGRAAFPSPKMLRLTLTQDEVGALYNHFLTTQVELGPIVTRMSDEEFEIWVRRLAEGGRASPFDLLSWDMRTTLVRSMASRLVDYWTDTSSVGQQPDDLTSNPSNEDERNPSENEPPSEGAEATSDRSDVTSDTNTEEGT